MYGFFSEPSITP